MPLAMDRQYAGNMSPLRNRQETSLTRITRRALSLNIFVYSHCSYLFINQRRSYVVYAHTELTLSSLKCRLGSRNMPIAFKNFSRCLKNWSLKLESGLDTSWNLETFGEDSL